MNSKRKLKHKNRILNTIKIFLAGNLFKILAFLLILNISPDFEILGFSQPDILQFLGSFAPVEIVKVKLISFDNIFNLQKEKEKN